MNSLNIDFFLYEFGRLHFTCCRLAAQWLNDVPFYGIDNPFPV
jgi:hypothetical protein